MSTAAIQQREIRQRIAAQLRTIPEVDTAFVSYDDGAVIVNVVVDDYSRPVRERIYDLEQQMLDAYPDLYILLYVRAKPPGRLAQDVISGTEILYERTAH